MTTPRPHTDGLLAAPPDRDSAPLGAQGAEVLRIAGLSRRFGKVLANDDISLRVRGGDVVALLGHNGAGKTTLVSQLVGLLRPHAGQIRVGGADAVADPAAARRRVALQAQAHAPLDGLTPRAAIEIAARLRGASRRESRSSAAALADELDIAQWMDRRALPDGAGISGGVRRLAAFAMAVAAPTPLLVLDEPTNDVDASRRRLLWQAVRRRADAGAGVLLVTHNVAEAERIVDELVILDHGRVVATGTPAGLRGTHGGDLRLELRGTAPGNPLGTVRGLGAPTVRRRSRRGHTDVLTISAQDASAAVAWAQALREARAIEDYSLCPATLEDVYLAHTAPDPAGTDPSEEAPHV